MSSAPIGATGAAADLHERAEELLDRARAAGAAEAEVYGTGGTSLSAKMEKGDLGQVQADEGATLGLRVLIDGRLGFTSTNQLDAGALERAAADAVAIARLSPPDEANVLGSAAALDASRLLGPRVDPLLAGLDVSEVVERARSLSAATSAHDGRISVDKATVSSVAARTVLRTTTGIAFDDGDAALTMSVMALAKDGEDTGGFDYGGHVLRDLADADAAAARLSARVARAVVGNLAARPGESYEGPVAFAPEAFTTAFLGPLLGAVSALAVQRGRSALAEKHGEIVAPGITILDDPTDRASAGARPFDREGTPTERLAIVQDGALRSFLHNGYTAAVAGSSSTGHAAGGPRGVPGLGAHAIQVETTAADSPEDEAALLRALGSGLYIQRLSGSVDPASGDFSGAAKSARWIEGGEVRHSVQEVMVAGNAFDLLARGITITRQRTRPTGNALLPWALVPGISVTGGS